VTQGEVQHGAEQEYVEYQLPQQQISVPAGVRTSVDVAIAAILDQEVSAALRDFESKPLVVDAAVCAHRIATAACAAGAGDVLRAAIDATHRYDVCRARVDAHKVAQPWCPELKLGAMDILVRGMRMRRAALVQATAALPAPMYVPHMPAAVVYALLRPHWAPPLPTFSLSQ
jgi:hypothetical protein